MGNIHFDTVSPGNNTEAQAFLSRHNGQGGQIIVRMRGLPYSATAEQVVSSDDHIYFLLVSLIMIDFLVSWCDVLGLLPDNK